MLHIPVSVWIAQPRRSHQIVQPIVPCYSFEAPFPQCFTPGMQVQVHAGSLPTYRYFRKAVLQGVVPDQVSILPDVITPVNALQCLVVTSSYPDDAF